MLTLAPASPCQLRAGPAPVLQHLCLPAWIEADVWTSERKVLEFLLWLFLQVTLTIRSLLKDSGVTSTSTLRRK